MSTPRSAAPGAPSTSRQATLSRRGLAAMVGSLALFHEAPVGAKNKFGKRHPHRPPCAEIGERPTGMRKRKGRKARPGRQCCEGLETDASGVCAEPPTT